MAERPLGLAPASRTRDKHASIMRVPMEFKQAVAAQAARDKVTMADVLRALVPVLTEHGAAVTP